ncbi:MAG TPA: hypothetical protein VD794_14330 [Flavisolibacter sp.]|nr:hypothetical protein [Flavisolibacter sp.]
METSSGTITIHRVDKSYLKKTPAKVLIASKLVDFLPGQTRSYQVPTGEAALVLNKKKLLTFDIGEEEKVFYIKEGLAEWRFLLTYSFRSLIMLVILYLGIKDILGQASYLGLFLGIWLVVGLVRDMKQDYFYLEEQ